MILASFDDRYLVKDELVEVVAHLNRLSLFPRCVTALMAVEPLLTHFEARRLAEAIVTDRTKECPVDGYTYVYQS